MARAFDGFVVVSPEYNGSMTPLLVNTLDWCSRVDRTNPTRSGLAIFADKPAALVGSSPGAFGGLRALIHLRDLLGYLGMVVIPQQVVIPRAHQAFDPDVLSNLISSEKRGGSRILPNSSSRKLTQRS